MTESADVALDSAIATRVAERNRQTRDLDTYGSHRQNTMRLLSLAAQNFPQSERASISVLGAGNCLELDLAELSKWFGRINLLDLDDSAVRHGLEAQLSRSDAESAALSNSVRLMAPIDLAIPLAGLTSEHFAEAGRIDRICSALESPFERLPAEPAEVVVSACVLSQMIDGLAMLLPSDHPQFVVLLQALRRGHLRRILQLSKPGGHGIFISDLVSSESAPALQDVGDSDLPRLLAECLSTGNFFSGLNPGIVAQDLKTCSELKDRCSDIQVQTPWKWQMGPRVYAVYAVTFRRRPGTDLAD